MTPPVTALWSGVLNIFNLAESEIKKLYNPQKRYNGITNLPNNG